MFIRFGRASKDKRRKLKNFCISKTLGKRSQNCRMAKLLYHSIATNYQITFWSRKQHALSKVPLFWNYVTIKGNISSYSCLKKYPGKYLCGSLFNNGRKDEEIRFRLFLANSIAAFDWTVVKPLKQWEASSQLDDGIHFKQLGIIVGNRPQFDQS